MADVGQELVLGPVGRLRRLLGAAHLFLGPFSFSHIADEGDEQVVLAQPDGGDADFGGELAAIAAQGLDIEDAVEQRPLGRRQEASQAPAVSFAELRGDDGSGQDAADRLGPRPAEGNLGLAVPLGDEAVGTHGDEGVVGVVEDESLALLAGAQLLLQLLVLRDIINNRDVISGLTGRVPLERGEQVDPDERAVLADVALLQSESGRFALPQHRERVDGDGQIIGMRYILDVLLQQFLAGVADDRAELLVDAQEAARGVPVGDADRRVLESPAKPLLALPQRLLGLPEVGNVGAGPEPFADIARVVPDRHTARLEPAVLPVRPAHAVFHVIGAAPRHRVGPECPGGLPVVRVQHLQPAPAQQVALGDSGVLRPLLAEVVAGAVGCGIQTICGSASVRLRQRCSLSRSATSARFLSVMSSKAPMIRLARPSRSRRM